MRRPEPWNSVRHRERVGAARARARDDFVPRAERQRIDPRLERQGAGRQLRRGRYSRIDVTVEAQGGADQTAARGRRNRRSAIVERSVVQARRVGGAALSTPPSHQSGGRDQWTSYDETVNLVSRHSICVHGADDERIVPSLARRSAHGARAGEGQSRWQAAHRQAECDGRRPDHHVQRLRVRSGGNAIGKGIRCREVRALALRCRTRARHLQDLALVERSPVETDLVDAPGEPCRDGTADPTAPDGEIVCARVVEERGDSRCGGSGKAIDEDRLHLARKNGRDMSPLIQWKLRPFDEVRLPRWSVSGPELDLAVLEIEFEGAVLEERLVRGVLQVGVHPELHAHLSWPQRGRHRPAHVQRAGEVERVADSPGRDTRRNHGGAVVELPGIASDRVRSIGLAAPIGGCSRWNRRTAKMGDGGLVAAHRDVDGIRGSRDVACPPVERAAAIRRGG